jgi:hypothetical protein
MSTAPGALPGSWSHLEFVAGDPKLGGP